MVGGDHLGYFDLVRHFMASVQKCFYCASQCWQLRKCSTLQWVRVSCVSSSSLGGLDTVVCRPHRGSQSHQHCIALRRNAFIHPATVHHNDASWAPVALASHTSFPCSFFTCSLGEYGAIHEVGLALICGGFVDGACGHSVCGLGLLIYSCRSLFEEVLRR